MIRPLHRSAAPPELSVILPCFDEAENLARVVGELDALLDTLPQHAEILLVDDASRDATPALFDELRRRHPRVRTARHARRCGQSAAFCTGLRLARGAQVAMLDADGQCDPADLPYLLDALRHADAVCGVRRERCDGPVKRLASRVGNGFRRRLTRDPTTDAGCTFRVVRAEALAELPVFDGLHRFLPALLRMQGFRVVERRVAHRPRLGGVSKYGVLDRLGRGLLDCLAMVWFRRRVIPARRVLVAETGSIPQLPSRARAAAAAAAPRPRAPERAPGLRDRGASARDRALPSLT